jgi:hypothetical protein
MSYLEQILQAAQQRGGLTDEEFGSIFQSFIPQQQSQPNLGIPQQFEQPQSIQRPQMIKQTQVPMQWGTGVNTAGFSKGKPNGVEGDGNVNLFQNVADQYQATQDYDTDMFSTQTQMLAEQDRGMEDEEEKGLMSFFGF